MSFLQGKTKKEALLTPEQEKAQKLLLAQIQKGNTAYEGSFDISSMFDPEFLKQISGSETIASPSSEVLNQMVQTGLPTDITAASRSIRESAQYSAERLGEELFAKGDEAGARYGSASRGTAALGIAGAKLGAQESIAKIDQMSQDQAKARQLQAAMFVRESAQKALEMGLEARRILMSAEQFETGMNYEEFKRLYPDVHSLAVAMLGNRVEYMVEQQSSTMMGILQLVASFYGARSR